MSEARSNRNLVLLAIILLTQGMAMIIMETGSRPAYAPPADYHYHTDYKPPYRWVGVGNNLEVDRVDSVGRICGVLYHDLFATPGPGDVIGKPPGEWTGYGYGFVSYDTSKAAAIEAIDKNCH